MNLNFVSIQGRSRNYRIAVAVLAALSLIGLACFALSYVQGHQTFGGSNTIPWGMPVTLLIYLIGLSAGSLILSTLTYVFGKEEYKPIARVAVLLSIVLIIGAMIAIIADLGRPEKFWRLFMFFYLNNMTSMFAINGVLYGGYLVISVVYLGIILSGNQKLCKRMGILAISWAALVHMGTGAIFGFIAAREAWFSPIKPLEFLAAAVTSGLALLIVATVLTLKSTGRDVRKDMITSLGRLLVVFIAILVGLILIDKLTHVYSPHREATMFLLTGKFSWIFWAFQIGLVAVVPLTILLNPRLKKSLKWVFIAAASVVVGIFFERYYLVIPGAAYPQHYYPGHIEGVYGAVGSFSLTFVEIFLAIGIISFITLLFLLGLKYMNVLPEKTEEEKAAFKLKNAPPEVSAPTEPTETAEPGGSPGAEPAPQAEPAAAEGGEQAEASPEVSEQPEAASQPADMLEEPDKSAEGG